MPNRDYEIAADLRTHQVCKEKARQFIPFFDPDFRMKPSNEMFKLGDEIFESRSTGRKIILEIEARDAEYEEHELKKGNYIHHSPINYFLDIS